MAGSAESVVEEVRRMAEQVVAPFRLEVVDVVFRRQGKHSLLRLDIDRPGPAGVSLEDCERTSRELERELDAAGLFQDAYELQVSSPGVDRPISTDDDVRRNTGRPVRVEMRGGVGGAPELRGVLLGADGDRLRLAVSGGEEIAIPRCDVLRARQDVEADLHGPGTGTGRRGKRDRRGIVGGSSS